MEEKKEEIDKNIEEMDRNTEKKYMKLIEATLFVSGRWMSIQELVAITNINPLLLKILIKKLKEKYEKEDSAIEILQKNEMWKMDIKKEFLYIAERLASGSSEFSKAEQATLAVIAYKQPIKQSIVVKIRGNKAYGHIKKFLELGLIRGKKLGHTLELSLTDEFYNYFSLHPEDVEKGIVRGLKNINKNNTS